MSTSVANKEFYFISTVLSERKQLRCLSLRLPHFSFRPWRTPLPNQFSSGDEGGCFLRLLCAVVEFGCQWSVCGPHVLACRLVTGTPPLKDNAPWLGLLDHMDTLEKAPGSAVGPCCQSVCSGLYAVSPGSLLSSGLQMVVIPAWFGHRGSPHDFLFAFVLRKLCG